MATHDQPSARERILQAAERVFAQYGPAGATTRRIAEEAGVNEVTLFRHFGSKEVLLEEATRLHATGEHAMPLPDVPVNPERELTAWVTREIERLRGSREFILQCLASEAANPAMVESGALPMSQAAAELQRYVERLNDAGRIRHPEERAVATTMFLATLYSDALGRAALPDVHHTDERAAPAMYVRVFLRALGVRP